MITETKQILNYS